MSDLALFVGGPFNGQTTHITTAGRSFVIDELTSTVLDYFLSSSREPLPSRRDVYDIVRGRQVAALFPSWRSYTGEDLKALLVAPSVKMMGLGYRSGIAEPTVTDRSNYERWLELQKIEERSLAEKLARSHREFKLVSEVDREDKTIPGGDRMIRFRWFADLTPEQLKTQWANETAGVL